MDLEKLKDLPTSTGVYIMKGAGNVILYIGKAKNLRSRVRSYFQKTADERYATKFLANRAEDIDVIVTANEKEAYLLEDTLLKQHRPKYNIRLKDDKTYVSIKITNERFPRILMTRQVKKDGAQYFGPYISAREVRDTIKFIRKIFPLCVCSSSVFRNRVRPCLDYQLGLCSAPAVGLITDEAYKSLVDNAAAFLEGRVAEIKKMLKLEMRSLSEAQEYEKAAIVRNRIHAMDAMLEAQTVVAHHGVDKDVFAIAGDSSHIVVQALYVRGGRLSGKGEFFFEERGVAQDELLSSFLIQFYSRGHLVPHEIIVPIELEDAKTVCELISGEGGRTTIVAPRRGERLKLLSMAEANAQEALKRRTDKKESAEALIVDLQKRLKLTLTPNVIEAFDISNIGGAYAVGAKVGFKNASPDKSSYRLYKVRTKDEPDDYAMMAEVLGRRLSPESIEKDPLPDLVIIDGGKGQLNVALTVLKELGLAKKFDVIALAKDKPSEEEPEGKGERVFKPNVKDPIALKEGVLADLLIRRVRDEVHRFAIKYHRKLRSTSLTSLLDEVPGIGPAKRKALIEEYGSLDAIQKAGIERLSKSPGMTKELAVSLLNYLSAKLDKNGVTTDDG